MSSVRFGDLLSGPVRNGVYKKKEFHGHGTKVVNMKELFSYDFITDQPELRIQLTNDELAKSHLLDGDLLFARRSFVLAGAGKCSLIVEPPEALTFESSMIRARPNPSLADSRFLYYFFKSPPGRARMASIAARTAVSGITGTNLSALELDIPAVNAQRHAANALQLFDDLIENNRRRVEVLEEMARAIYREWFVKFRYPGHEDVPRVDSPHGPIPEGWEVAPASRAIMVNPRIKLDKSVEHPFIAMGDLDERNMGCRPSQVRSGGSGAKFQRGDTLFARITPCLENGKTGLVQSLDEGEVGLGSTEFIVLRGKDVGPAFVYCLAREDAFRKHAIASMSGASGRQRVRSECFDTYLLAVPPRELTDAFESTMEPLFSDAAVLMDESRSLQLLRDLLLPKLVTGQIDVSKFDLDGSLGEMVE